MLAFNFKLRRYSMGTSAFPSERWRDETATDFIGKLTANGPAGTDE
jgi:hypothetical protein